MSRPELDLVVIGGGSAGASTAYHAAKAGLRTCVVERSVRGDAGARWVNAVPDWTFDEAGIARPNAPESRGYDEPFHLQIGDGEASVRIESHGLYDVDMRHLCARLLDLAERHGAEIRDGAQVMRVDGTHVYTSRGVLHARFIVDASGLSGVRLFPS